MEIKKLLTRILLAVGLLAMGENAWAEATVIYGRAMTTGGDYTAWSSSDAASSGSDLNVWIGNMVYNDSYGLYSKGTGNRSSVLTFSHTANSLQTFDIVFNNLTNTGDGGNYSYIKIGNEIEIRSNQQNQNGHVIINGVSTAISDCNMKNYNRGGDSWTIHVEINSLEKKVTAFTLVGTTMNGKSAHYTMASVTELSSSATFNTVTIGFVRVKGTPETALTSIKIAEEKQDVSTAGYTINYKFGDNLVKSVSSEDAIGSTITADKAIDGTEAGYEGKHYLITAAEAPTMTLVSEAASNVLNVPVRAPLTATLKVTTTIGTNDPVLVETPLVETDAKVHAWSYAYPMYVLNDGKYYKADNTTTFGEGGEFTDGQVIEKSVTYSTIAEDVVFFQEAEAAAGTTYSYSNGGSGYVGAQNARDRGISVGTLPAGTYQFTVNITAANRRSLCIRQSTNDPLAIVGTSNEDMETGVKSASFTLVEETSNLWINGANSGTVKTNQSEDFDYVLIKKVPESLSGTIASSGYTTLSSAYGLDFTTATVTEGKLVAYAVTEIQQDKVVMTSVDEMSANQGVVLKGTANATYTIPVKLGAAYEGTNLLKAAVEATPVGADEAYILKEGKFIKVTAASTVPAGKAYLLASDIPAGAREMTFVFNDDTTTGISNVNAEKMLNSDFFDLQGRRVAAPQKGLYIVSGKKVIIK